MLEHNDTFLSASLTLKLTAPGATLRDVNDGFDGEVTAPPKLARELLRNIRAPEKRFVLVQDAGHFGLFMRPDAFLDQLSAVLSARRPGSRGPRT